MLNFNSTNRF